MSLTMSLMRISHAWAGMALVATLVALPARLSAQTPEPERAAVLANAVEDALRPLDIKIRKVPLTPSYLWSLIVQARAAGRCL